MDYALGPGGKDPDALLTLKEAGDHLPGGVSVQTLRRWLKSGAAGKKLEVVRIGGRVYTTWRAVREFMEYPR